MKYLQIIISGVLLAVTAFTVQAQMQGVAISAPSVKIEGGMVNVRMRVEAERLDIGCNGSYRLVPFIEKEGVRLQLPEIVYAGSQRYKFDKRREYLSRDLIPEVYKAFPKANKRTPEVVDYDITVPFMAWMGGAKVKYEWIRYACDGETVLLTEYLPESETIEKHIYRHIPDPLLYADVVFYSPEREQYRDPFTQKILEGKHRSVSADLYINFPQDIPEIQTGYMDNVKELGKVDSLTSYIMDNDLMSVTGMSIVGYASPEGPLWRNTNLARYRADNLYKYIADRYDISNIAVSKKSVPVDWQGLEKMLTESDIPFRDGILGVIEDISGDEQREKIIAGIAGGIPHKRLLAEIYPKLRRTQLKIDFTVEGLTAARAKELLYANPELLSLEEMYMVAAGYEPGTDKYAEVFIIAAKQFPDEFIAVNNAAAAVLQKGDTAGAYKYIMKIAHDPRAYSNVGTYYYLLGDIRQAENYFQMAVEEGIPGAAERLRMIEEK